MSAFKWLEFSKSARARAMQWKEMAADWPSQKERYEINIQDAIKSAKFYLANARNMKGPYLP